MTFGPGGIHDSAEDREIVVNRTFQARPELVWLAWTERERIEQWWGPEGMSTTVEEMDLRPGGRWKYVMMAPDGTQYPVEGIFADIIEPELLVATDEFGEDYQYSGDLPQGVVTSVSLRDTGTGTEMTLRMVHRSAEDRAVHEQMGVEGGWNSSFNRLDRYLASLE